MIWPFFNQDFKKNAILPQTLCELRLICDSIVPQRQKRFCLLYWIKPHTSVKRLKKATITPSFFAFLVNIPNALFFLFCVSPF